MAFLRRWPVVWSAFVVACGGAEQPATEPRAAEPTAATPVVAERAAPAPAQPPGAVLAPVVLAPAKARFGRVIEFEEQAPLWSFPRLLPRVEPKPERYERWREKRKVTVGFSHLTMAALSPDDRYLLAVSENEAKLRIYDAANGKLLGSSAVQGYAQWGRGFFAWQPASGEPPPVLFAYDGGIVSLDALTGKPLQLLAGAGAWELRSSDDGAILGANLPNIGSQTSVLAFFAWKDGGLVPALGLRFSERVDGFDLSQDKSLLAVSYYPSSQVELLDLKNRKLLWSEPAPNYASSVDISPDDALVAVGGAYAVIYDAKNPTQYSRFNDFGNNIDQVLFSPSGDALAVSAYEGKVRILKPGADILQPLKLLKLLRHAGTANVYALSFTARGDQLVSSSGDKTVRFWGE